MNEPRKERFLLGRAAQIVMVGHKIEGLLPALAFLPSFSPDLHIQGVSSLPVNLV